jgi:hypothetical protein
MAQDSKRELIIEAVKTKLVDLQWPTEVRRGRADFDMLKSLAITQFPFIGISAGLPTPIQSPATIRSSRTSHASYAAFISTLRIEIITYDYIYDNSQYDTLISTRADDIWAKIYEDPSFGNRCLSCLVEPEPIVGVWVPYLAFKLTAVVKYNHGTGGI